MNLHLTTVFIIVLDQFNKFMSQGIPVSPCPKVFQYRFDGAQWFGIVSLQNPNVDHVLHLKVSMSMRGKPIGNYLGEIELLTRGQYRTNTPVLYKIKFPRNPFPPKLLQIAANNQIVCVGTADHSVFVTQIQLEHTRKFTFIPSDNVVPSLHPATSPTTVPNTSFLEGFDTRFLPVEQNEKSALKKVKDICGQTGNTRSRLTIDGIEILTSDELEDNESLFTTQSTGPAGRISRGAWPWLVAIYVNNFTSLTYQCGGTLISSRIIISAAHCFTTRERQYTANEILVFLGRHNLKNWNEEGSLAVPCENIFIHPAFDRQLKSYDADIAVLALKNEVKFNAFIRPACAWAGSTDLHYIEGERGVVVGWGTTVGELTGAIRDPRRLASLSAAPQMVAAPILSNEVCFKSNDTFRSLSSNRTFCAGKRNTGGPCSGDSGAGLLILKDNRWMLRGTVSATLPLSDSKGSCNTNEYVIYTDVAKFLDWIFAFII